MDSKNEQIHDLIGRPTVPTGDRPGQRSIALLTRTERVGNSSLLRTRGADKDHLGPMSRPISEPDDAPACALERGSPG